MPYKAFISYSHAADGQLAPTLQSALHRFAKPFYRLRAIRVFRDKTNLQLSPELWPLIQEALAESEYFLLLASPAAAQSPWVRSEVDEWLKLKDGSLDKFLIILTEGEIAWDQATADFAWDATALPENLRGKFKAEPLYSDLRWAKKATDLSLRHPQFLEEIGSIGATLHGKPKDAMIGQDVRQHRLFKFVAGVVALLLLALSVGASGAAFYANRQRKVAEERRREAERQSNIAFSRELASSANSQLNVDPEVSTLLATEAVKVSRTAQAEAALRQAVFESRLRAVMHVYEGTGNASNQPCSNRGESCVYDAAFSPDGKYVVTASGDTTPRVWEAQTGKLVSKMEGHTGSVWHAEFSPDARLVLSVGDFTARLWEAQTGKPVREMGHPESVSLRDGPFVIYGAFSPDGKYIVTASHDDTARVWETDTGLPVAVMRGHTEDLISAAFSPDGKSVATASWDQTARVWEASTGKPVSVMSGHREKVLSVAFSPDGKLVVTASLDKTARVWEALTGKPVNELRGHMGAVSHAVFSPRGNDVLTAGEDGTARVWEASTGKVLAELRGHTSAVTKAAFSHDGRFIITAGGDGTARAWEASFPAKGEEEEKVETDPLMVTVKQVRWRSLGVLRGHTGALLNATFSPDGEYIVTASIDGTARVWEASFPQNLEQLHGPASKVMVAAFSPDGKYLATADDDPYAVRVWKVSTGRNVALLHIDDHADRSVTFSPDSRFLVTERGAWETGAWKNVSRQSFGKAQFSSDSKHVLIEGSVWETNTWQKVFDIPEPEKEARFSPGGKFIATTSEKEGKTRVRHVDTWSVAEEFSAVIASFSPDGELILTRASQEQSTGQVWDTSTWRKVAELPEGGHRWSPDSQLVVSMNDGREVRVWEARTGRRVAELREYGDVKEPERDKVRVNSVAFSPNGKLLLTASSDMTARVWEAVTGKEVSVLRGHDKAVRSAAFSPDGSLVVTVGDDQTVRVWETATGLSLTEYRGQEDWAEAAVFSPDGKFILTNPEELRAQVYACDVCYSLEDILVLARRHVTRELSTEEREKYLHQMERK